MAAPPPALASAQNVAPSDSSLVPRREFLKHPRTPSSFSILTFSGSSQIRLYSFPSGAVVAVRSLLDRTRIVLGHKEDVLRNHVEFTVDGKPWASPKSLPSEKLLLDIIAVLLHEGFDFHSTFDFGREQDDKVIMAFSRLGSSTGQRSTPPSPALHSSQHRFSQSSSTAAHTSRLVKHPFALSFPNATTLRVISPPLASTPAILQSVRGAWTRGVDSEHKIGPDTYEFKLKGYKWFQEDTFASDSLDFILSLLASLDSFGFSFMTSLVITNRSRVKDFWIFTDLTDFAALEPPLSQPSTSSESRTELKPPHFSRPLSEDAAQREPVSPLSTAEIGRARGHGRSRTFGGRSPQELSSPKRASFSRKPAPRAQLPISVASSIGEEDVRVNPEPSPRRRRSDELIRIPLQSSVGSAVDMTGIGTRQFQSTPERTSPPPIPAAKASTPPTFYQSPALDHNSYFPNYLGHGGDNAQPAGVHQALTLQHSRQPLSIPVDPHFQPRLPSLAINSEKTPPLLNPGIFRESVFSSGSALSSEIPITWTGLIDDPSVKGQPRVQTPVVPGGWSSPAAEPPSPTSTDNAANDHSGLNFLPRPQDMTPERQEVNAASAFSVTQPAQETMRTSEAGVVDEVPHESPRLAPPSPAAETLPRPSSRDKTDSPASPSATSEGWVLINVTGGPALAAGAPSPRPLARLQDDIHAAPRELRLMQPKPGVSQQHAEAPPASLTAAAHQIVDNKTRHSPTANSNDGANVLRHRRGRSGNHIGTKAVALTGLAISPTEHSPSSPLRHIFSQSKSSKKAGVRRSSFEGILSETTKSPSKSRPGLRERWRRRGVVEVTAKTDRRMSVD